MKSLFVKNRPVPADVQKFYLAMNRTENIINVLSLGNDFHFVTETEDLSENTHRLFTFVKTGQQVPANGKYIGTTGVDIVIERMQMPKSIFDPIASKDVEIKRTEFVNAYEIPIAADGDGAIILAADYDGYRVRWFENIAAEFEKNWKTAESKAFSEMAGFLREGRDLYDTLKKSSDRFSQEFIMAVEKSEREGEYLEKLVTVKKVLN